MSSETPNQEPDNSSDIETKTTIDQPQYPNQDLLLKTEKLLRPNRVQFKKSIFREMDFL